MTQILKALALCSLMLGLHSTYAQVSTWETPPSWELPENALKKSNAIELSWRAPTWKDSTFHGGELYLAGERIDTKVSLSNAGVWTDVVGGQIWQCAIRVPEADKIGGRFSNFKLMPGQRMFFYNGSKTHILGAITAQNNPVNGSFNFVSIPGEELHIELFNPKGVPVPEFVLNKIYPIKLRNGLNAGSCHTNTICPAGDNYRDQIKSVGILTIYDYGFCSGTLLNNDCGDGRLLFLSAHHCFEFYSPSSVIVDFGFEATSCDGDTAFFSKSVSGARMLASSESSDFALLELLEQPPPFYDLYFSGWNATSTPATSSVCIHHPDGTRKRICRDDDKLGATTTSGVSAWRVNNWEDGATEQGSSGAGLFNSSGQVVGQLYGGFSSCSNTDEDYFGRLDLSFNNITRIDQQLQHWITPCGSNNSSLDGMYVMESQKWFDLSLVSIEGLGKYACNNHSVRFNVKNLGTVPVENFKIEVATSSSTITLPWSGFLASGAAVTVETNLELNEEDNELSATVVLTNQTDEAQGNNSKSHSFTALTKSDQWELNLTLDNYPDETTWALRDEAGYMLYDGGPYPLADSLQTKTIGLGCLTDGCYDLWVYDAYGDGISGTSAQTEGRVVVRDSLNQIKLDIAGDSFEAISHNTICEYAEINFHDDLGIQVVSNHPADGQISVQILPERETNHELILFDLSGKLIGSTIIPSLQIGEVINLNYSTITESGTYLLEVADGKERATTKVVFIR